MESQDVAPATDMHGSRDERLRLFAEGDTGSAHACRGESYRNDCNRGPGRLRPIGPGYYL